MSHDVMLCLMSRRVTITILAFDLILVISTLSQSVINSPKYDFVLFFHEYIYYGLFFIKEH